MKKNNIKLGAYDAEVYEKLSVPEVFADLFNGSVFGGREIVRPEMLQQAAERETLCTGEDGQCPQILYMTRDISQETFLGETLLRVILNVEGQRLVHYAMPLRVMQYDAARYGREYRKLRQKHRKAGELKKNSAEFLSGILQSDRLPPVLTLVFYYGEKQDWDGPLSLHEMLRFPEELEDSKRWFPDYRINLVSSRTVQKDLFRTGLREVFELLDVMGNSGDLENLLKRREEHYSSLEPDRANLIGTFLNVPELKKRAEMAGKRKENVDMCTAIREMMSRSREEGIQQGMQEGMLQIIRNMITQKYTDQQIMEICGITPQYLAGIKKEL